VIPSESACQAEVNGQNVRMQPEPVTSKELNASNLLEARPVCGGERAGPDPEIARSRLRLSAVGRLIWIPIAALVPLLPWSTVAAEAGAGDLPQPKHIRIPAEHATIDIDGVLGEAVWERAVKLTPFFLNDGSGRERENTVVRLWYDDQALYLGWTCADADILATFTERDSRFWEEEVAEFFITSGRLDRYFELQWNPLGGEFDAIIVNELDERGVSKRFEGDWGYTAAGMESAVKVVGTIKDSSDRDQLWQAEVRVPWVDLGGGSPKPGDVWRGNFYRFNRETGREVELLSWSPTLLTGFHQPSRFGYLEFGGGQRTVQREISETEMTDKLAGFWIGQLVGNYMGFPFENVYEAEPCPVFVDRYYNFQDAAQVRMNDKDLRGFTHIFADAFEGAWSDDDTDIEFVTLHAVERYGLDMTYPEITEMWKRHINRKIWVANRTARNLMDQGLMPPATGSKENNSNWFQIDPQLVNEIWSAFYPGMTRQAVARAEWGARITNDDWGIHPTLAYAVMYSAAFFEQDTRKLVDLALGVLPEDSPFTEGVSDVIRWHREHSDWRETRKRIHEKYWRYRQGSYEAPVSLVSSLCNGLCGIMAILYGEGDFVRTVGIAVTAGYDCDNQAATCGGLIGVMHGARAIPEGFTLGLPARSRWTKPFNDQYLNFSRDHLPNLTKISDLVLRTRAIAEQAIEDNGGRKMARDGESVYRIVCDF